MSTIKGKLQIPHLTASLAMPPCNAMKVSKCLKHSWSNNDKMRQKLNGSVTVTQRYYDSAIETNGGKSDMIKVT